MAKKSSGEELTRCSGTMTESQYLAFIRSALRSKWLRWKPRSDAIKLAQRPYEGNNKRQKYIYSCAICGLDVNSSEIEVDHFPKDAGSILSVDDIGQFCNNLFCEVDNLRVVHKSCHKTYTYSQRMGISFDEAALLKEVIRITKEEKLEDILVFLQDYGYTDNSTIAKRKANLENLFRNI